MEAKLRKEKKTSAKKKLADVGIDRRDSSRKPSNVSPTETAHLYICTYLVLTIHTTEAERGFRCHDEHSTVKTRERSRLSQERLEQLMQVRMSDVSRSNITENSFFSESVFGMKQRRAALFTWIPDCPQLPSLIRSLTSSQEMITYQLEILLHNKTWRNTKLQLSKRAVENRDRFDFSSISSDIKPSEKEASKLPQIMKKIAMEACLWRLAAL
jgi:hypothetical protein